MTAPRSVSPHELLGLFSNHEHIAYCRPVSPLPELASGPDADRRIAVVGGGTAGWLTALALRRDLPWVEVTLIESKNVPVIGVGEATVPSILPFLHSYLRIDVAALYRAVEPTWKQGIRFEWGLPGDYCFQAPFDWHINGVGMVGALREEGHINAMSLQSVLMSRDRTAILSDTDGVHRSLLSLLPFAYHLDNVRLIRFLREVAAERGVVHLDHTIRDVVRDDRGDVTSVVVDGGQALSFDFYVDCSGFRSLLLEGVMGSKFISFADSLYTDQAVTFNLDHGGHIKPYTTARTMEHGWCWNIPMRDEDHLGYVHASRFCTADEALDEARSVFPGLRDPRVVRFRSGRHEDVWRGNVAAVGNAYAFVEPLESSGLLMICNTITALSDGLRCGKRNQAAREAVNKTIAHAWERLRWFLAIHFKFNRRSASRFWQECNRSVDVSGIQPALDLFMEGGPLGYRPRQIRERLGGIVFYEVAGFDTILMGQQVPIHLPCELDDPAIWRQRRDAAHAIAHRALPQAEALAVVEAHPEMLMEPFATPGSWIPRVLAGW